MKAGIIAVLMLVLTGAVPFAAVLNEVEPNDCITLIDGGDAYQALQPGDSVLGLVSPGLAEGCLYFEYTDGNEYIEDLYALNIVQGGNYSISLGYTGTADLDLYLYDIADLDNLRILNPADCGDFYCGVTCGNPEIVNVYLGPGVYLMGVSLSEIGSCTPPMATSYALAVGTTTGGDKPSIDSLKKAANPFRLFVYGQNFSSDTKVYISGIDWQNISFVGSEMIKLKKGNSLKAMFPKDGSWVPITIVNPGNVSTTIEYNRSTNQWYEGGLR